MEEEKEVRRAEDQLGYNPTVKSRAPKIVYISPFESMSELQREREPAEDEDMDEGGVTSAPYHDAKPVIDRATEEGVWSHPLFSAPLSLPNCCALSLNRHRELHLQ
jgi:hypothetical protein